jgi:microcystin degradation protein MlrC
MVAYRTYPHVDMRDTGVRALRLIEHLLRGGRRKLAKAYRPLPFLMPIHRQSTFTEPAKSIYAELEAIERDDRAVASMSLLMGFPLADISMCWPTVLAYADTPEAADSAAERLVEFIAAREGEFAPGLLNADDAVRAALTHNGQKPVLLADVQDNAGAGGTSDTMGLVEALVRANAPDAIVGLVYDPESAWNAHKAGQGASVALKLGGKLVAGHKPLRAEFIVERLADGPFPLTGPMLGGFTANLGKVALLRLGGVRIVVASERTQCNDQAYFRHAGIEPAEHRVIAVKSTNHYRADFQALADRVIEVAAPSVYDVDPANLPFTRLREGLRLSGNGPEFQRRG